ncbi:hypothetical protein SAMN02745130_01221 [Thiothrix eikelboomii]|uniref:Uncharacterized protein n=1 Tax=Thiothrix eikelboomii TaxID=92487 RepID=A0A1T4W831_9GAMM|nr:hypothetical protein [Thiothrix eikelboomii]SKA73420.1 hypothetical protein SAMN02745130_01221 [Thiothrix eikelboomii]
MKKHQLAQIICGLTTSAVLCSLPLTIAAQEQGRSYGLGHPFQLQELPKSPLKDKLNTYPVKNGKKLKLGWIASNFMTAICPLCV